MSGAEVDADDAGPAGSPLPIAALAARLLAELPADSSPVLYVARNERRALLLAGMLSRLAPALEVLLFPGWDCVPYDRAAPSRHVMGNRVSVLRRLAAGADGPSVVVTTPEALSQRVPPRALLQGCAFHLRVGDALEAEELNSFLRRTGYILDDRVDEAGEAALRGAVIDLFPAGSDQPIRLDHADGQVTGIRRYDPASQRTLGEEEALTLLPASEVVLHLADEAEAAEHFPGIEHFLPDFCGVETLFDYLPDARLCLEPGAEEATQTFWAQVVDAHELRRTVPRGNGGRPPLPPEQLYLEPAEWARSTAELRRLELELEGLEPVPRFSRRSDPGGDFATFVAAQLAAGRTVALLAANGRDLRAMVRRVREAGGAEPRAAPDWAAVLAAPAGTLATLAAELDAGFIDAQRGVAAVSAADVLGRRAGQGREDAAARAGLGIGEADLRPGDVVIHIDHGMGLLRGIETVAPSGGAAEDTIVLEFADAAKLLLPAEEMGRIWRYGGDPHAVTLDRLGGSTWPKRRAGLESDLAELAGKLVVLAAERAEAKAVRLAPPRRAYERFAARFPFTESPDQARAIEAVLDDLESGRPMDRLVCGDVGFGKTEVALRAAAAAALAGRQVAVIAPTTVLVRQHVQTFRRRFAETGLDVAQLSRLVKPAEARAVKQGLASGETRIVVGTQALAGNGVRFRDLGLLIIDEEQRFGARQKAKLRALGQGVHVLTLTATPIPRTLQLAMVGLQDFSIIATPPARRQPVRTFVTAFDPVTVRAALMREQARGGQSFVVCPRIEDIGPMAERLVELVPELQVVVAHGKLPAEEIDAAMVDFADGTGDVLLATNIIESGLDVPRANTILIWRADRFGLSQLHQLRGRVGRGRARGTAYLLTDPAATIGKATERRLRTIEAFDRLGAGFAISGRDLDHRGAGDLLGEQQAGHVRLIGMGLYQHLLGRAVAVASGEAPEADWTPSVRLGLDAVVPEDYVPEPEIRINLHARLSRPGPDDEPEELAAEIGDRFGPLPEPVTNLLALADFRRQARRLGIDKLDAGPEAIAATFRDGAALAAVRRMAPGVAPEAEWRGERLVWARGSATAGERRRLAAEFLGRIAGKATAERVSRREPEPAPAG